MTDKELKHLSRMELIDIIYELQKQNEQNAAQIEKLQAALDEKELHIENAGSIAEAAVQISGVLEAAQAAADQYLLSIRAATADMDAKAQAAEQQRDALLADAKKQSDEMLQSAQSQSERLVQDAQSRAQTLEAEAEKQVSAKWDRFEQRAMELIQAHEELRSLVRMDI